VPLLTIGNGLRRGFAQFHLSAHFLDCHSKRFDLFLEARNSRSLLLHRVVLFEELVEQHRVDLLVADCQRVSFVVQSALYRAEEVIVPSWPFPLMPTMVAEAPRLAPKIPPTSAMISHSVTRRNSVLFALYTATTKLADCVTQRFNESQRRQSLSRLTEIVIVPVPSV
jgi:hypothetical protein